MEGEDKKHIRSGYDEGINRNITDPSTLTYQTIWREIAALKELLLSHIDRIDNAVIVAHEDLVRVPTDVQEIVGTLKALYEEKFKSVDKVFHEFEAIRNEKFASVEKQFLERDIRRDGLEKYLKEYIDTSFKSAKEMVVQQNEFIKQANDKQEASFTKQIEAQGLFIKTTAASLESKIDNIKETVTSNEGKSSGRKDLWGYLIGGIGLLATIITILMVVLKAKTG